ICNDYDFYLRVAKKYKIGMTEEFLYRYYFHSGNLSGNLLSGYHEVIDILKSLEPVPALGVTKDLLQKAIRKHSRSFCGAAANAMEDKKYSLAFKYYFSGLCQEPLIGLRVRWGRII